MDAPVSGYLLLADVSGYTAFLTRSEQDRAHDILRLLFSELVSAVPAPFRVAEIEGDAVFAYAPDAEGPIGAGIVDICERIYFAFHSRREHLERNTACGCIACHEFPDLDLKVVVHHGEFVLQPPVGGYAPKPAGRDVIIAHRLLKNGIPESTGVGAYAAFTDAAYLQSGLSGLASCAETYEHIGDVGLRVHDLAEAWRSERARRRVVVDSPDAWFTVEIEIPAPPALAWAYLNEPAHKREWMGADALTSTHGPTGRAGVGTLHRCAHGDELVFEEVVDWRPFDYVTCDAAGPAGGRIRTTTYLDPTELGTRLRRVASRPRGRNAWHQRLVVGPAGVWGRPRAMERTRRQLGRLSEIASELR